jgi:hypothetical protein
MLKKKMLAGLSALLATLAMSCVALADDGGPVSADFNAQMGASPVLRRAKKAKTKRKHASKKAHSAKKSVKTAKRTKRAKRPAAQPAPMGGMDQGAPAVPVDPNAPSQ